jgi:hypothetical protein
MPSRYEAGDFAYRETLENETYGANEFNVPYVDANRCHFTARLMSR